MRRNGWIIEGRRRQILRPYCTYESQTPEQLRWIHFFDNPSLWWDNRARKWTNQPDFKHSSTGESLWITSSKWLEEKLKLLEDPKPRLTRASYRRTTPAIIQSCHSGSKSEVLSLLASLKQTSSSGDLETGKNLHAEAIKTGLDKNLYVSSALVNMYVKCGSLEEAREVFSGMKSHSEVSWNSLIMGYSESGDGNMALELLEQMKRDGYVPNERTLVAALKACRALAMEEEAKVVKRKMIKLEALERAGALLSDSTCGLDVFVLSTLVDLFGKCGSMDLAWEAFNKMPAHNVVSWTSLVLGYAENGEGELALELFQQMPRRGISPNSLTFVAALKACCSLAENEEQGSLKVSSLEKGMFLHSEILKTRNDSEILVYNSLIDMYSRCGSLLDARIVFDKAEHHTVVSWNSLLLGYSENNEEELGLELFGFMGNSCEPNSRTYVALIKACSSSLKSGPEFLHRGLEIHTRVSELGFDSDIFVANALVEMYSKSGSLVNARSVFEAISCKNSSSWSGLMAGFTENGEPELALKLFDRMQRETSQVSAGVFAAALKACTSLGSQERGSGIYKLVIGAGLENDRFVSTNLVEMYSKCGCMREAEQVFNNMPLKGIFLWTALMMGYVENDEPEAALELFRRMKHEPDSIAYVAALKACSSLAMKDDGKLKLQALEKGMEIHSRAREAGFESNLLLVNTLVEMYSRAGSMLDARALFDRMKHRSVGVWNSLLLGYGENHEVELVMELFSFMLANPEFSLVDHRSFLAAFKALSSSNVVDLGTLKALHRGICRLGFAEEGLLATSLMDSYGKAGSSRLARLVFESVGFTGDLVTWNSLMGAYNQLGDARGVLDCFVEMRLQGLRGDSVTFVVILTACSRAGLIDDGKKVFSEIKRRFGVEPGVEHFVCMVDLLGRGNELDLALEILMRSIPESRVAWTVLLGACKKWNNVRIGEIAFEKLVRIDQGSQAAYVLMANVYSSANK